MENKEHVITEVDEDKVAEVATRLVLACEDVGAVIILTLRYDGTIGTHVDGMDAALSDAAVDLSHDIMEHLGAERVSEYGETMH